jgi:hypothetical protein
MRNPVTWYVVLLSVCIAAPYLLRVAPRRHRDWIWLTVTIGFLTWLLAGFVSVRSV